MARFNEILTGRHNRFLQKLFQMKGPAPVPQLAGDIQPSISFFSGAEHRFLESWQRFGSGFQRLAIAGQPNSIRFRNPAGSNMIAVFEKIAVAETVADAAGALRLGASTQDENTILAASVSGRLDARGQQNTGLILSGNSAAPLGGVGVQIAVPILVANAIPYDFIWTDAQEITLLPGDCLQWLSNAVNVGTNWTAWWRERGLEASELSLGP